MSMEQPMARSVSWKALRVHKNRAESSNRAAAMVIKATLNHRRGIESPQL